VSSPRARSACGTRACSTPRPSLAAAMVQALALRGGECVLEVGTGLG
jgi:protein-L-isoaspartate O-methyltransferase